MKSLWRNLIRKRDVEHDLDLEMRSFVELLAQEKQRSGMSPDEANRAALVETGIEQTKEAVRAARAGAWLDSLGADIRAAFRVVRRSPGFVAVSALSLALGIGVNVTCFSSLNALLLHPFPFPALDRIVTLWEAAPKAGGHREPVAPAHFLDWKNGSQSFETLAAYRRWDASLTGDGEPERVQAGRVSPEFFAVFGMRPLQGRTFKQEEGEPGRDHVAVLSYGFWKARMASAPATVGRTVSLGHVPYTVIGIMPEDFDFPLSTELWTPLALTPAEKEDRINASLFAIGRLKPGIPVATMRAEMSALSYRAAQRYPNTDKGRAVSVLPLREFTDEVTTRFLFVLLGAAGFVLLLACANVANLNLSRAMARQKEMGVRAALGASSFRIARQLLAESILVALLGATLGLMMGAMNLAWLHRTIPPSALEVVPGLRTMHVDGYVAAFTLLAALASGVLCSVPAIFQLLRGQVQGALNDALKQGGRTGATSPIRNRLRSAIVIAQAALALVLLIGAGLMVNTLDKMLDVNAGFDPNKLLTMRVSLPSSDYQDPARILAFQKTALEGLAVAPGVVAAGVRADVGLAHGVQIEGRGEPQPGEPRPEIAAVSPRYLDALKLPVVRGRGITGDDGPDSPRVVVLSESVRRFYWPDSDPIGRRIQLGGKSAPWLTVVGVVDDIRDWFNGQRQQAAYVPFVQVPGSQLSFAIRTGGEPLRFAGTGRSAISHADSNVPAFDVKTMQDKISDEVSGVRSAADMMTTFAAIALVLAGAGIYSISSFFVAQRTHEIGVRMALGAAKTDILVMALRHSLTMAGAGLAIGLPLAIAMAALMSSALYGVVSVDWFELAALTSALGLLAAIAGYIPARRASQVDPMIAIRHE